MKKVVTAIILLMALTLTSEAQNVNWRTLNNENQNSVYLNMGYDFGMTTQLGYSRYIHAFKPILLNVDYSMPMGEDLFDDAKLRGGGQLEIFEKNEFSISAKILGIARKYQTDLVNIKNFGVELSVTSGYYKPTWHIAGEFGFDKSILSQLEHSHIMKENYPNIKDGWYLPSGGNYFYGIQASKTVKDSYDISARIGGTNAQANNEDALLPYYMQLGLTVRF